MMARRQIERSEVAVLVIDAAEGVTSGDLAIAGTIWELGRAAVVAINKWDLLDDEKREKLELSVRAARRAAGDAGAGQRLGAHAAAGSRSSGRRSTGPRRLPPQARHRPAQPPVREFTKKVARPRSAARPGSSITPPRSRPRRRPSCCSPTGRCRGTITTGATWRTACARSSTCPACRCGW